MKRLLLLTIGLTLSGCAVLSNDTGCKKIGGIKGCVSLDEVNTLSETGQLPDQVKPLKKNPETPKLSAYTSTIPDIGQPVRQGDHIQQITIFPYQDSEGNYHEASIIYTILQSAHWIDHPVGEVQSGEI